MERPSIAVEIACPLIPRVQTTPHLEDVLDRITCPVFSGNSHLCPFSRGRTVKIVASRRGFTCFIDDEQVDPDKNRGLGEFLNTHDRRLTSLVHDLGAFLNSKKVFGMQVFNEELRVAVAGNLEKSLQQNDAEVFCSGSLWIEVCDPTTLAFAAAPLEATETLARIIGLAEGLDGEKLEKKLRGARRIRQLLDNPKCVILVNKCEGTPYSTLYKLVATRAAENMLSETVRRVQNRIMDRNTRIFEGLQRRRQAAKDAEAASKAEAATKIVEPVVPVEAAPEGDTDAVEPVPESQAEDVLVEPADVEVISEPQAEPADAAPVAAINEAPEVVVAE